MADRADHRLIAGFINPGERVLDLGCGDGDLLSLLVREKKVKAHGIELKEEAIYKCVEKGLSVFHGDIETGLGGYTDASFDVVILNQSLQEVRDVDFLIREVLRVGRRVVVGFPNFAHWRARCQVFFGGKGPVSPALPYRWNNTPNVRYLSVADFQDYCRAEGVRILNAGFLSGNRPVRRLPNLRSDLAFFLISR